MKSPEVVVEAFDLSERAHRLLGDVLRMKRQLQTNGHIILPAFFHPGELEVLREIWRRASVDAKGRDTVITYAGLTSTRRIHTLSATAVSQRSSLLDQIYCDKALLALFSAITGTQVVPLEDPLEKYVINALLAEGDHHGEHLDSFPFSCSVPLVQPSRGYGGRLQIAAPYSPREPDDVEVGAGDLVFFLSDKLVHRVTSISSGFHRVVLNMAYATPQTMAVKSPSGDLLYA